MHMPNGRMFFIGTLSMIVAIGRFSASTPFSGVTTSALGAAPNEHIIWAPSTTGMAMTAHRSPAAWLTCPNGIEVATAFRRCPCCGGR